jgi:transcriptional regulator with XRE-family HTH domain
MTTISERIASVRKAKELSQQRFSGMLGVSRSYLSEVESGKSKPSIEILVGIATVFTDINSDWVLTGKGEMYRQPAQQPPARDTADAAAMTPKQAAAVQLLLQLPEDELDRIRTHLQDRQQIAEMREQLADLKRKTA